MGEPYIVAEIASAHEGDPALAVRLSELAATTGADAVKFQLFNRSALMSRYHHKFEAFGEIELSPEQWCQVLADAAGHGLDVFVEAFDLPSLELAEASGVVNGYKIPTSDIGNLALLERGAQTGKPLHLAVGGATEAEIELAVATLRAAGAGNRVVLMHGFQSFPTKVEDTNLARLPALAARHALPTGYADHVDAEDGLLAIVVPLMALALGAVVIEKHMTDDRARKGRDHYSSMNPDELAAFVVLARQAARAVGSSAPALSQAEQDYRHLMKKQAVARRSLTAGSVLDPADITFKRTGRPGLAATDVARLSGSRLVRDRAEDESIAGEDLE